MSESKILIVCDSAGKKKLSIEKIAKNIREERKERLCKSGHKVDLCDALRRQG